MANPLPPVPFQSPIIKENGFLSQRWDGWFRKAFEKIGGSVALTLPEIEAQLSAVQSQADSLQAQLNNLSIDENYTELNQGTVL